MLKEFGKEEKRPTYEDFKTEALKNHKVKSEYEALNYFYKMKEKLLTETK